jgi:hypothetical protein
MSMPRGRIRAQGGPALRGAYDFSNLAPTVALWAGVARGRRVRRLWLHRGGRLPFSPRETDDATARAASAGVIGLLGSRTAHALRPHSKI